jgi:hypothetical protein
VADGEVDFTSLGKFSEILMRIIVGTIEEMAEKNNAVVKISNCLCGYLVRINQRRAMLFPKELWRVGFGFKEALGHVVFSMIEKMAEESIAVVKISSCVRGHLVRINQRRRAALEIRHAALEIRRRATLETQRQKIREAGHCVYCFDYFSSEPIANKLSDETYGKPEWACWDWDNDLDIPPNPCVKEWSTVKARSLYDLENWRTDLPDWRRKICIDIIQSHTTTAEDVPNTNNGHRWFNPHRLFDKEDNEKFAQYHIDYIEEWIPRQDQVWRHRPKWVGSCSDRRCISPQKYRDWYQIMIYAYPEAHEWWLECAD